MTTPTDPAQAAALDQAVIDAMRQLALAWQADPPDSTGIKVARLALEVAREARGYA